jgi:DNA-binding IclR family transcriptional regulator
VLQAFTGQAGSRAARIRREQLFIADGDVVPELSAIAAPVFGPDEQFAGVLALSMPAVRFAPAHAPLVAAAARRVTERLGGSCPETRRGNGRAR